MKGKKNPYPYLLPNLFSATILLIDLVLTGFFLEESLEEARELPPLKNRVKNLFSWLWQFTGGARHPTYIRHQVRHDARPRVDGAIGEETEDESTPDGSDAQSLLSVPEMFSNNNHHLSSKEIFNRDTILLLGTYLVFQLSNISFNSLYPIFASAHEPTGRELSPEEIGLSLSFAGMVTIVFQVGIFGKLKEKMGNKRTYRAGLFLFFLSMMMMPWVGHRSLTGIGSGKVWLWIELGFVLLVKTVAAVGGLTSALLLVYFSFSLSMAQALTYYADHKLSSKSLRAWNTERPGPNSLRCWQSSGSFSLWRTLLTSNEGTTQGRSSRMGNLWRYRVPWLDREFWD
jgi:hypothetical protein